MENGKPFLMLADQQIPLRGSLGRLLRDSGRKVPQFAGLQEVVDESLERRVLPGLAGVVIPEQAIEDCPSPDQQTAGTLRAGGSLQELMEGYRQYQSATQWLLNEKFSNWALPCIFGGGVLGFFGGAAAGFYRWGMTDPPVKVLFVHFLSSVVGGIAGSFAVGYSLFRKERKEYQKQLEEAKLKWQPVKKVFPGDIVVVNFGGHSDNYRMGLVYETAPDNFTILSRDFPASPSPGGNAVQSYTVKSGPSPEKVIAVLEPAAVPLTVEQLETSPHSSALACLSSQGSLTFGFLGKKKIDGVSLYNDLGYGNLSGEFTYEEMQKQAVAPYLLTPISQAA